MIQDVFAFLNFGGPVVLILIGFSVVATTLALLKLWQFFRMRNVNGAEPSLLIELLEKSETSQAKLMSKGQVNPRAKLIVQAVDLFEKQTMSIADIKQELARNARKSISKLDEYLRPLEVIATIAPLLGLFGTVLGMIEAFQAMEAAGKNVNPAILSGGIWQALLTTAVGLAVAIPVSMVHSYFERKVERETLAIQDDLARISTYFASKVNHKKSVGMENV